ncbi:GumC family protein [Pontiella sulfatireligans]|uniref:GumC family protein n=1 Tax=Pontiella sulfatireligans TaxID=2750658 RepID=UPI00144462FF|nr:polysaccharide biosynthesis tyrosine autokinase [Pontiella sulfatireligans]
MNPIKLLRMVLRRWYLPGALAFVGLGVGVYLAMTAVRIYKAEAEIEMSVSRPQIIKSDVVFDDGGESRDIDVVFNTRFAKFRSPAMEELVTEEYFKRYSNDEYITCPSWVGLEELAYWVRQVYWWKDGQANIVHISFECPDAEFAAQLVNVMIDCASKLMVQENKARSDGAVQWLVDQAEEQRSDLEELEQQLADLRQDLQMDSLLQRREVLSQMLGTLTQEKAQIENRLASKNTNWEYVTSWKDGNNALETLPAGLPKEERLVELIDAWRAASDELDQLATRYSEIHPRYQQAATTKARTLARLEQFVDVSAQAVENEIQLLEKQIEQMSVRIASMETELLELEMTLAAGERKVQKFERKRDAAEVSYLSVLERTESTRLAAEQDTAFVKILRAAEIPIIPVAPDKKKIVITCIFVALLFGAGLAVLIEFLMDRITSVNDLKEYNLNILGALPSDKLVKSRAELATASIRDKFGPMVEVFAGINGIMLSEAFKSRSKVVVVCSVSPGEGKTVSACNLATSSARNGAKTLLIDGDLRRPRIAEVFAVDEKHPSLFEWFFNSDTGLDHAHLISSNVIEDLDLITSRPLKESNPATILGRKELVALINWARLHYDRVIIDSPPLGPVGDGMILASHADSVILVSRIGKTSRRKLKLVLSRLIKVDVYILGCIANDVPYSLAGKFGGAEGYGYGQGYKSYTSD